MSYNRGYQQGGGSPYRSNMNQNMGQQRSMVSPWQCGVVPNSRSQVQNILPIAQAPVNSNMLAQQHALAVASNLLSTLGMLPQQQQQQHQELPSLLNLAGISSNNTSYQHQLQNFGQGSMNNRFGNNNLGSIRRKQEQVSYRSEPYNKSRGRQSAGQHHQQGRGRNPPFSKTHPDRKPATAAVRANDKTPASSKGLTDLRLKLQKPEKEQGESDDGAENGKDETVAKDAESTDKESVGESLLVSDICMEEEAKRDDEDETKAKKKNKRDWKDEKKSDIVTNEEVTTPVKEGADTDELAVTSPLPTKVDEDEKKKRKVGDNDKREQKNADKVFSCHVCDKSAQGEAAYVRHMNSKPHKIAMETLSEQYKIEADGMRRNMQTSVRLEELQIDKLKRMGKTARMTYNRDYCKMCDLNFYGTLPAHRRNEKHLALKTFLHPRCIPCDKEFPTRLEWDNHNLSILHQLRVYQKVDKDSQDLSGIKSVLEIPELKSSEPDVDDEIFIEEDEQVRYDPTQRYGLEVTIPGFHCTVCEVFFQKRNDHCETKSHFKKWLEYKMKEKEAEDIAKKAEAEVFAEQESNTADPVIAAMEVDAIADSDSSAAPKDDDEGNWKRRRVENEEEEEDDDSEMVTLSSTERGITFVELDNTPLNISDGSAPYDPLEAADSESMTDGSKGVLEGDDPILVDLEEAISDVQDADKLVIKLDSDTDDNVPMKGAKARRGGRGSTPRGRKRK